MPRATFSGPQADPNFKIEDGVRDALKSNAIAQVAASVLAKDYNLRSETHPSEQSSLEEKCAVIADVVDAHFDVCGENVWFRWKTRG